MSARFRQAGTLAGQIGHHALRLVGTLALVVILLIGAASWRLSRGPVDLPILASRIGIAATNAIPGGIVTIAHAGLAWEGFNHGGAPIDLRLSGINIMGGHGVVSARLSRLRVTLAPLPLLRGRIAPIDIVAPHTTVVIRPGNNPQPAPRPQAARLAHAASLLGRLVGTLALPPRQGGLDLADLRRIAITNAHVTLADRAAGLTLTAHNARLTFTRSPDNILHGTATAIIRHRTASAPLHITITGANGLGAVEAVLGPANPAALAPTQSMLARADLPLTITAAWPVGRRATARLTLTTHAGTGHIKAGGSNIAIAGADATITATATTADLAHASLTLAGINNTQGPTATATGTVSLAGTLPGVIDTTIDHVTAAELPLDWPLHLAPGPRKYVVHHVTAGAAHDGQFHTRFTLAPPAGTPSLDDFTGNFSASGVTLLWLKHATPLTGLAGTLTFPDQDIVAIHARSGQLGGLAMTGRMTIADLTHRDQNALVVARLTGSATAAAPLLNAPPLKLAANGIALAGTTGTLDARIDAGIKLVKHVTLADVTLATSTTITNLHLPLPIPGIALDQGNLTLNASLKHLALRGNGSLAGAPTRFTAAMALPNGSFTLDANTTAGRRLLTSLGATTSILKSGAAPLAIRYHNAKGAGTLRLTANLTPLALALPALGWSKPAGTRGQAAIALALRHGAPNAVQSIDITAPNLALRGVTTSNALRIDQATLNETTATGKLSPPANPGAPWVLALAGTTLDLAAPLHAANHTAAAPRHQNLRHNPGKPGTPLKWRLRAAFDHIRLGKIPAPSLGAVHIDATGTSTHLNNLTTTIQTDPDHTATLRLTHSHATDSVSLTAGNVGALFTALGTTSDIANGTLRLNTTTSGTTTTGTAIMTDFRLRHAPVIAKIIQGLSLYGVPAATSGPGLAFSRLTAPFTVTGPVVRLGSGRAYSASLGFTATGTINIAQKQYDLSGTIVPAYALNTLPGRIPLIGKMFSPEKGSGLFAARYSVIGPFAHPAIAINPLAALTPGFLRELFNLFNHTPPPSPARP